MDENNTLNLILQYVYGETNSSQTLEIKNILDTDELMYAYYQELLEVKTQLDDLFEEPNPTTVAIIHEHSHDSHTEAV